MLASSTNGDCQRIGDLIDSGATLTLRNANGRNFMHEIVLSGRSACMERALERSPIAKVTEERDNDGRSPLYTAAQNGQTEMARLLLSKGADVNAQDKDGWAPLHLAATKGHLDIARLLVDGGASVNLFSYSQQTPFDQACKHNHMDIAKYLHGKGARVRPVDSKRYDPIWHVANRGHTPFHRVRHQLCSRCRGRSLVRCVPQRSHCDSESPYSKWS